MYFYACKTKLLIAITVVLAAGWMTILGPLICFADGKAPVIKDFDRPPAFHSGELDLENLESRIYKAIGEVHAMDDKAIVVGDIQYNLEPGARITCPIGSYVGLKVNNRGRVIACDPVRRPQPRGR